MQAWDKEDKPESTQRLPFPDNRSSSGLLKIKIKSRVERCDNDPFSKYALQRVVTLDRKTRHSELAIDINNLNKKSFPIT